MTRQIILATVLILATVHVSAATVFHNINGYTPSADGIRQFEAMVFDTEPSARPVPNLDKLKAYDSYITWLRDQVKEEGQQ